MPTLLSLLHLVLSSVQYEVKSHYEQVIMDMKGEVL